MTSENIGSSYLTTMELMRMHPGSLHLSQQPTTYPELQELIKPEDYLQAVFKPIGESLDNGRAQTPNNNNNNETGVSGEPSTCSNGNRQNTEKSFTEELSIKVDSEEESGHSWRPSLGNSLSSDFFLTQSKSVPGEGNIHQVPLQLPDWEMGNHSNEPSASIPDLEFKPYSDPSHSRHDVQSYVQSQKAEMNILKYEVMSARRKINESRAAIGHLIRRLNEVSVFQNSQEIAKLTNENAQLRLECQCLCMEVDFYLKGQAPLGEVDEDFYVKNNAAQSNRTEISPPQPESRPSESEAQDSEEGNKWKCPQCTFDNHPAINCCEMCHDLRPRRGSQHYNCSSQDTCFCHPQSS